MTLARLKRDVTEDAVIKELRGWKGKRYPEADVRTMFRRLEGHLPQ